MRTIEWDLETNLENKHGGPKEEVCFGVKLSFETARTDENKRRTSLFKEDATGYHLKTIVTIDI